MTRVFTIFELFLGLLLVFGSVGWVLNVIKIVQTGFVIIDGMFVARCIGVFVAPLGAILGFC